VSPPLKTEVLIVGGGPAGCAAAMTARKAGLEVVLLEARAASVPAPGETLHPGIEPIFAQLGLHERICEAGFHRHRGIWVDWGAPQVFQPYGEDINGPWLGFQADRGKFSALLLEAVRAVGATVLQSHRATRILHEHGRVIGVETPDRQLHARWVIDAGGGRHWLAKQVGLKVQPYSSRLIAQFGWRKPVELASDDPSLSACQDGWNWEARIDANRTAWCKLRISCLARNSRISAIRGHRRHIDIFGACDVTWRLVSRCAGLGYFMLGDAAAVIDPASSHGILRAMMSGIKAGNTIAHICDGFPEIDAARDYNTWLTDWFAHDVRALQALYRKHPNLPSWGVMQSH
jgi:flavin-dependent dehydrogenase